MRALIIFFSLVLFTPIAYTNNSNHYQYSAEVAYSIANPDFSPFDDGEGISLHADVFFNEHWYAYGRYTDVTFTPSSGAFQGDITEWLELGSGYRKHYFGGKLYSEAVLSYLQNTLDGKNESGYAVHAGVGYKPFKSLEFRFQTARLDLVIKDWHLLFEIQYHFLNHAFASARLRDYADWDFTYYEFGLGLKF